MPDRDAAQRQGLPARAPEAAALEADGLRRLLDLSAVGIVEMGADGSFVYANPTAEHLLGIPRGSVSRRVFHLPDWRIASPDGRALADHEMPGARALRGETVRGFLHTVGPAGARRVVSMDAEPVRGTGGEVVGAVGSMVDVTDRHRVETRADALRRVTALLSGAHTAEQVVRALADDALGVLGAHAVRLALLTAGGEVEIAAAAGVPGARVDAVLAASGPPLALEEAARTGRPVVLCSPEAIAARYPETTSRYAAMGGRALVAVPLPGVAGVPIGAMSAVYPDPCDFAGEEEAFLAEVAQQAGQALERIRLFAAERRARQEAEAARAAAERTARHLGGMQALTAALSSALAVDEIARVVLEQAVPLYGAGGASVLLLDGDELVNVGWVGYEAGVMGEWLRYPLRTGTPGGDVASAGQPVFLTGWADWERLYPQWTEWVRARGFPAFAGLPMAVDGRPVGTLAFNFAEPREFPADDRDSMLAFAQQAAQAVDRARLLQSERDAAAAAREANEAKAHFLVAMSHELRTPLNAIGGYAQILEMGVHGPVTPAQAADLARIQGAQRHLLGLIEAVLDYAKIEAGREQYRLADVRVGDVVAGVEVLIAPQMQAKSLAYVLEGCDGDAGGTLLVRADAEKVRQILANLLSNATKFTGPGGSIRVECGAEGGMGTIRVADSGIGISAAELESAFTPFVQLAQGSSERRQGTGLGLAISREMARAMGGDLTATSTVGVGSTFTLALPLA